MEKEKFKGMNIWAFIILLIAILVVGIVAYNITTKQKDVPYLTESKEKETNNATEVKDIDVSVEYTDENLLKMFLINNFWDFF